MGSSANRRRSALDTRSVLSLRGGRPERNCCAQRNINPNLYKQYTTFQSELLRGVSSVPAASMWTEAIPMGRTRPRICAPSDSTAGSSAERNTPREQDQQPENSHSAWYRIGGRTSSPKTRIAPGTGSGAGPEGAHTERTVARSGGGRLPIPRLPLPVPAVRPGPMRTSNRGCRWPCRRLAILRGPSVADSPAKCSLRDERPQTQASGRGAGNARCLGPPPGREAKSRLPRR